MKRLITDKLIQWNEEEKPLPILLYGARQVGKTYVILDFAKTFYKDKYIYVNFFENNNLAKKLDGITSPETILNILSFEFDINHLDNSWLLIFDEVQEVPSLKTALKMFVDKHLDYRIICIGSYLGNTLEKKDASFPVGKVHLWNMFPMNFQEFLIALNKESYIHKIKEAISNLKPLDKIVHEQLNSLLHTYMIVGGMPQVVLSYINKVNSLELLNMKKELYHSYQKDILKYLGKNSEKTKCISVFDAMKIFFAKEHNRFYLNEIDTTARYLNYQNAIKNLLISRIVYKVNNIKKPSAPLTVVQMESQFKLYFNDCGFVSALFNMDEMMFDNKDNVYANQRGAIAENYFFNELSFLNNNDELFYYSFKGNSAESENDQYIQDNTNTNYEVDAILENTQYHLVPIEIKFGKKYSVKSLNKILNAKNVEYAIIFSNNNISYDSNKRVLELPLYCVGFLKIVNNRIDLKI